MNPYRGGSRGTGAAAHSPVENAVVAADPARGIYAIASASELFNTAPLDVAGDTVTRPITAYVVHAYAPDANITNQSGCASADTGSLDITGSCTATLTTATTTPTSAVGVTVSFFDNGSTAILYGASR